MAIVLIAGIVVVVNIIVITGIVVIVMIEFHRMSGLRPLSRGLFSRRVGIPRPDEEGEGDHSSLGTVFYFEKIKQVS